MLNAGGNATFNQVFSFHKKAQTLSMKVQVVDSDSFEDTEDPFIDGNKTSNNTSNGGASVTTSKGRYQPVIFQNKKVREACEQVLDRVKSKQERKGELVNHFVHKLKQSKAHNAFGRGNERALAKVMSSRVLSGAMKLDQPLEAPFISRAAEDAGDELATAGPSLDSRSEGWKKISATTKVQSALMRLRADVRDAKGSTREASSEMSAPRHDPASVVTQKSGVPLSRQKLSFITIDRIEEQVGGLQSKVSALDTRMRTIESSMADQMELFLKMQDTLIDISRQVGVSRRDDGELRPHTATSDASTGNLEDLYEVIKEA